MWAPEPTPNVQYRRNQRRARSSVVAVRMRPDKSVWLWSDLADREVIDGLGEPGLIEAVELLGGFDPGELDDRSPELADQAQRDLLARALIEQDPAALCHRDRLQVAQPHRRRRLGRPLTVNQVPHDLWQHAQSAQHPDHRRLAAQLE